MSSEARRDAVVEPLPPLPPGDYARTGPKRGADVPFWNAPAGYCRWCGEDLGVRLRDGSPSPHVRWHGRCVTAYQSFSPQSQRARIWAREIGECQGCGRFVPQRATVRDPDAVPRFYWGGPTDETHFRRWAVDHITPLWDGGLNEDANLQLLCDPCHKDKTAAEATLRAAKRRPPQEPAPDDPQVAFDFAGVTDE